MKYMYGSGCGDVEMVVVACCGDVEMVVVACIDVVVGIDVDVVVEDTNNCGFRYGAMFLLGPANEE